MKIVERVRFGSRGQGTLIRYEGSRNWYSCYCVKGKEHRESTETAELKLARRFHRQKLDEIAADRQGLKTFMGPAAKNLRLGELLDSLEADYRLRGVKSWAQFQSHLKPIRQHFAEWRVLEVTAEAIDTYIEERLAAEMAAATVNRETQLLGQALRLGRERHRLTSMPTLRRLSEQNIRLGFFEADEFRKLIAALPDYLQDVTRFAYLVGWRRGEILSLRWTDVDRTGRVIRLRSEESKNGRGRVVTVDGDLGELIERRWQARLISAKDVPRVTDLVFHNQGEPIVDFRKAWASACVKAGLYYVVKDEAGKEKQFPEKLFHDLRRTAVRDMVRAGVPERVAMEISGHRTRSVFDRYNIVSEADLRAAMQKRQAYARA